MNARRLMALDGLCLSFVVAHLILAGDRTWWSLASWEALPRPVQWLLVGGFLALLIPTATHRVVRALDRVDCVIAGAAAHVPRSLALGATGIAFACSCRLLAEARRFGDGPLAFLHVTHSPLYSAIFTTLRTVFLGADPASWQVEPASRELIRIMSSACGGLYLVYALLLVRLLGLQGAARILGILLLMGTGSIQVFMGHLETYALPSVLLLAIMVYAVAFLRQRQSLRAVLVTFAIAVAAYLGTLWYLPAVVLLMLVGLTRTRSFGLAVRYSLVAVGLCLVLIAISMLAQLELRFDGDPARLRSHTPFSDGYRTGVRDGFISVWPPTREGRYTFLSAPHVRQVVNTVLLTTGVLVPAALLLLLRRRPRVVEITALGAFAALGLLFDLVWFPAWRVPRDWNLFALPGFTLVVLVLVLVARLPEGQRARVALPLAASGTAHSAVWVLANHG